ncbi:hypothetical protein AX15_007736 [Amanita polypyramis BW_CC]|nr:hypothetical protein AX15_007736 [Amanita polypyramis BW_CC]
MLRQSPLALFVTSLLASQALGYQSPEPQYEQLEQFLYEGRRADGSNLASIVHPCRRRQGVLTSIAAEWLRFAFHDMSTYDSTNGTGGLDASIAYELDFPGNFGLGFTDTQSDLESFPNKYVSRSDIIALATVFAVSTCGGPILPYRGGRVDAATAGPEGPPEPQQDLQTHTQMFTRMGFTQAEMIQLVACGHTVGSVRSSDFPNLVAPNSQNPDTPVLDPFDTTTLQFDNKVVTEYLSDATQNPLVITSNVTMQSDLRIFSSDGNVTMQSISSPQGFTSTCQNILERMINTVPHGVSLTDEIQLIPAKVHDVGLTIEKNQLLFKASFRLVQPVNATVNSKRVVTMFWCDRYGNNANCSHGSKSSQSAQTEQLDPNISPVTYSMGITFIRYKFVVPINSTTSVSNFWFQVDERNGTHPTVYNNGGNGYELQQDQIISVPAMGSITFVANPTRRGGGPPSNVTYTTTYNLVAGVRQELNPSQIYANAFDSAIHLYKSVFNKTIQLMQDNSQSPVAGYKFYTGSVSDVGLQLTVDLYAEANGAQYMLDFQQTSNLGNTPYIVPTNVTDSSSTLASTAHNDAAAGVRLVTSRTAVLSLGATLAISVMALTLS